MTAIRTTAVASTILAAAFAASLSSAAMAGSKKQNQTGGTTPSPAVVAPTGNGSANTAANIHALTVYLQWQKCKDNILPECP